MQIAAVRQETFAARSGAITRTGLYTAHNPRGMATINTANAFFTASPSALSGFRRQERPRADHDAPGDPVHAAWRTFAFKRFSRPGGRVGV